jgi:hypothetical protein
VNPADEYSFNPYQDALFSVSSVLLEYDSDRLVPVYGFGGKILEKNGLHGPTRHAFKLSETEVDGVDGIMNAYRSSLAVVKLGGPTLLRPIINEAAKQAAKTAAE